MQADLRGLLVAHTTFLEMSFRRSNVPLDFTKSEIYLKYKSVFTFLKIMQNVEKYKISLCLSLSQRWTIFTDISLLKLHSL